VWICTSHGSELGVAGNFLCALEKQVAVKSDLLGHRGRNSTSTFIIGERHPSAILQRLAAACPKVSRSELQVACVMDIVLFGKCYRCKRLWRFWLHRLRTDVGLSKIFELDKLLESLILYWLDSSSAQGLDKPSSNPISGSRAG
jgi:hypothetical protein